MDLYPVQPSGYQYIVLLCLKCAGLAQLVEQLICNQQVAGSSPITSSNPFREYSRWTGARVAKGDGL